MTEWLSTAQHMMFVNKIKKKKDWVTNGGNQHDLKPRETIKYRNRSIRNRDNTDFKITMQYLFRN